MMELTIKTFIKEEDSLIIATESHQDELKKLEKNCKIVLPENLSGIEAKWIVITADDQGWRYETLSRARNGLAILIDLSAENWYVFRRCYSVFFALFMLHFMTFSKKYCFL